MRHRLWLLLGAGLVVALAAGVAALLVADTSKLAGDDRGVAAVPFRLPDIHAEERTIALADFSGHPVVLNFWTAACGPCRHEMPALESAAARYRGRVGFVGVDHEDSRADGLRFLATTRVSYPIGFDPTGATAQAYQLRGLPTTVFIRADGKVLFRHTGPLTTAQLLEGVRGLMAAAGGRGR
jgi:thiol-disulfide isomerase/thioredoxin